MAGFKTSETLTDGTGLKYVHERNDNFADILSFMQDFSVRFLDLEKLIGRQNDWKSELYSGNPELFKALGLNFNTWNTSTGSKPNGFRTLFDRISDLEQATFIGAQNAYKAEINSLEIMSLLQCLLQSFAIPTQRNRIKTLKTGSKIYKISLPQYDSAFGTIRQQLNSLSYNLALVSNRKPIQLNEDKFIQSGGNLGANTY